VKQTAKKRSVFVHLQIFIVSCHSRLNLLKVHLILILRLSPRLLDLNVILPIVHTIHIRMAHVSWANPCILIRIVVSNISQLVFDLTIRIETMLQNACHRPVPDNIALECVLFRRYFRVCFTVVVGWSFGSVSVMPACGDGAEESSDPGSRWSCSGKVAVRVGIRENGKQSCTPLAVLRVDVCTLKRVKELGQVILEVMLTAELVCTLAEVFEGFVASLSV
jgi:hypothetical protein